MYFHYFKTKFEIIFQDLKQSFLKTMQALLGDNFSQQDYQSWNRVYDIMLCYMFKGYPN